ncbi:hypothetical protein GL218_01145 [Daldinia childiae]|uniref:uncharacterized protein n=1 Tax=Daldinia childiae TaxID=326645 RepID=UPI001445C12B|nr:uncharacterized protein GL218_01145 [Daldinia childiae]KAF3063587.1 hypothetical protein GL218_01145 [Daldinia childiae]
MAREWRDQSSIPSNKTISAFEEDRQIRVLFHTFNRKTLRSLLLGTLPHDLYDKDSPNWENVYDQSGPGTYVVGVSIEGRHGAFLSRNEIEKLVGRLQDYRDGWEAWQEIEREDSFSQDDLSRAQKSAIQKALTIDNVMLSDDDKWQLTDEFTQPRCAGGNISNLDELIAMLGRRVDARFDGEVHQISCPAYVGYDHRVPSKMQQHNPDYSSMAQSSNTLKLLISCIRYMGLNPIVHTVPMVMVWEESDVPLAEILVTVLAQSLVTINGLNVAQPGTSPSSGDDNRDVYFENKRHVWLERPWLMANVEETLAVRSNRDLYVNTVKKIREDFMSAEELRENVREIKEGRKRLDKAYAEIRELIRMRLPQQQAARRRVDEIERSLEITRGLFPNLKYSRDRDTVNNSDEDAADLLDT